MIAASTRLVESSMVISQSRAKPSFGPFMKPVAFGDHCCDRAGGQHAVSTRPKLSIVHQRHAVEAHLHLLMQSFTSDIQIHRARLWRKHFVCTQPWFIDEKKSLQCLRC